MRTLWIAAFAALAAGCGGTYGYETAGAYGADTYGFGDGYRTAAYAAVFTDIAPPAPLAEVVPPQPGLGYAWVNGYWDWTGDRYVWRRGRWDLRPSGSVWLRHGWVYDRGRYRLVPGRWVPRARYRPPAYVHRYPGVRYGNRYAALPWGGSYHPYAHVPREYYHPRYQGEYGRRYQGRVWATPYDPGYRRTPPARAYVVP